MLFGRRAIFQGRHDEQRFFTLTHSFVNLYETLVKCLEADLLYEEVVDEAGWNPRTLQWETKPFARLRAKKEARSYQSKNSLKLTKLPYYVEIYH
ncbi:MAG: hypothetical protein ACFB0B_00195 [Thermonemataceae bacterium]